LVGSVSFFSVKSSLSLFGLLNGSTLEPFNVFTHGSSEFFSALLRWSTIEVVVNNQLDDIMDNNNLYGTPSEKSTEKLRTAMSKDVERLQGRAIQ
jgi:hypothetical protein